VQRFAGKDGWMGKFVDRRYTLFLGLTAGQTYVVTVSSVGAAGPSDWNDAAQLMVV
jgi:hypothetical protein